MTENTYWLKQVDKPLFPDIEWSLPERREQAGKLLIIGGNKQGFASVAKTHQESLTSGIGKTKLILPDSLRSLPGLAQNPDITFASSTAGGALGVDSWTSVKAGIDWADMVLLPGDLGHNHETLQLANKIVTSSKATTLSLEIAEQMLQEMPTIANLEQCLVFCDFRLIQKLSKTLKHTSAFTADMSLENFIDNICKLTAPYSFCLICEFNGVITVAQHGRASTTKTALDPKKAMKIITYATQLSKTLFEAATAAAYTA